MKLVSRRMLTAASLCLAVVSAPSWAATAQDCQKVVDEISITGRANYDSATEAELTKYINAASMLLMEKKDNAQAVSQLKLYQQKLDEATKAQKIKAGDSAVLKDKSSKAIQCINSLK